MGAFDNGTAVGVPEKAVTVMMKNFVRILSNQIVFSPTIMILPWYKIKSRVRCFHCIFLCGSTAVPEERKPLVRRKETVKPEQGYRT